MMSLNIANIILITGSDLLKQNIIDKIGDISNTENIVVEEFAKIPLFLNPKKST